MNQAIDTNPVGGAGMIRNQIATLVHEADATPVRVFECLFTLVFLGWLCHRFETADEWLTQAGFHLTKAEAYRLGYPSVWPLLASWQVPLFELGSLLAAGAVLWPLGAQRPWLLPWGRAWSRRAGLTFLCLAAIYAQGVDYIITFSGNKLFVGVFAILALAPSFSSHPQNKGLMQPILVLRVLQATLVINYFASGLAKMDDQWLKSQDVLWSVVQGIVCTDLASWSVQHIPKWGWSCMQHAALIFEVGAPLWFYFRALRPAVLVFGLLFHLMIALLMEDLIFFSALMWSFYALFITPAQWKFLSGWLKKRW